MTIAIRINGVEDEQALILSPSEYEYETEQRIWTGAVTVFEQEYALTFTESPKGKISEIIANNEIITTKEHLENQINMLLIECIENEQMGVEDNDTSSILEHVPYDPKRIKIRNENWSIKYIYELIEEYDDVNLSPDFQREFVWDTKRKSRLIESLMLGIPIPAFYLSENLNGKLQVVDGLQRLTVIRSFLNNDFALKHLEYLQVECNGKFFNKKDSDKVIDFEYVKRILQTQINVNIIESSSPLKVKYDVFRRINTGGRPLNNQEIRNCLAEPHTRELLNTLAYSNEFVEATGGSVKSTRMDSQEMVLRFISFYYMMVLPEDLNNLDVLKLNAYKGDMQSLLDDTIGVLNSHNKKHHKEISEAFIQAMKNAKHLFGDYAFRKCRQKDLDPGARRQLINKSLFTTWSLVLSFYNYRNVIGNNTESMMSRIVAIELEKDGTYWESVSVYTNDKSKLEYGFRKCLEIVKNNMGYE